MQEICKISQVKQACLLFAQIPIHMSKGLQMTVVENPSKEKPIQLLLRMNPWNNFSWLTIEAALVELPQLHEGKASPRPALRLFLDAYSLQKNCKGKFCMKYFFYLWKHYIKQSRVQWLTLLLGILVFSSPLLACNNSKLHKVRKWDQHKVQTNFHIKGLA